VPSSVEVLAPPPLRRRPVLRAVLTVAVLGLVAWGVVARLSAGDEEAPAAAPPPPAASTPSGALPMGSPPWVRYPTPLEGRWVSGGPHRVTLVIHNAYLDVWQGVGQRQGAPFARRVIVVVGDRIHVRAPGDSVEVTTYRWRISGKRLTFELVDQAPESTSGLAGALFERR
jgi:hypothetical protein